MQQITPFLWFESGAEEAVEFYTSIVDNSRIGKTTLYPDVMPDLAGTVMTVEFELLGQSFMAINGGPVPGMQFSGGVSFMIVCDTQEEIDKLWDAFMDGGTPQQCGWIIDKFGVTWQVVPADLDKLLYGGDEKSNVAIQAMLQMVKLDINELQRIYDET